MCHCRKKQRKDLRVNAPTVTKGVCGEYMNVEKNDLNKWVTETHHNTYETSLETPAKVGWDTVDYISQLR